MILLNSHSQPLTMIRNKAKKTLFGLGASSLNLLKTACNGLKNICCFDSSVDEFRLGLARVEVQNVCIVAGSISFIKSFKSTTQVSNKRGTLFIFSLFPAYDYGVISEIIILS